MTDEQRKALDAIGDAMELAEKIVKAIDDARPTRRVVVRALGYVIGTVVADAPEELRPLMVAAHAEAMRLVVEVDRIFAPKVEA